jgi:hypothetical protein
VLLALPAINRDLHVAYDYAKVLEAQGQTQEAILRYREAYETRRSISP